MVSRSSGRSFERVNILKAIEATGRDPFTQENITVDDLSDNRALQESMMSLGVITEDEVEA